MSVSLGAYWRQAEPYQKFLYAVGAALVLSAVFHAGVLVVTGGSWEGDVSWRKPILFGESFGLTAVFIAWILTFSPRNRLLGWLLCGTLGVMYLYEVAWVAFQQWRGVPSHFNSNTPFDQSLFALAGVAIGFGGMVILAVTLLAVFRLQAPPSLAWAIRAGLVFLVAGQGFGGLIIQNDGSVFGAAGAMKVPHALSLHGLQVLPVLGWILGLSPGSESRRVRIVAAACLGYGLLLGASTYQTFTGRPPLELDFATGGALAAGGILLAGAYWAGLARLRRAPA